MINKKNNIKKILLTLAFIGFFCLVGAAHAAPEPDSYAPAGDPQSHDPVPSSNVTNEATPSDLGSPAVMGSGGAYTNQEKIPGAEPTSDFVTYLQQIINFGFAVIGILALFMLIIGAYQYLMAAGSGKAESAKETITSALLGLILGLCAWVILNKINPDLVNMQAISQITGGAISGGTPLVAGVVGNYTATKPSGDRSAATMAYADKIKQYAQANNVPENIAFGLVAQESGGNPIARSGAGAMGLTQLMPGTAAGLGVTDPYNADQSLNGGLKYLKQMYDQTGSWDSALAAYNCGIGRFKNASTWENLPAETKTHVPAVMGYANWYSQQTGFGSGARIM
jgi:hypothetical protein